MVRLSGFSGRQNGQYFVPIHSLVNSGQCFFMLGYNFSLFDLGIYDPIFITVLLFFRFFSIASFTLSHRLLLPFHLDYCMLFFTFFIFFIFIQGSYQPFLNS